MPWKKCWNRRKEDLGFLSYSFRLFQHFFHGMASCDLRVVQLSVLRHWPILTQRGLRQNGDRLSVKRNMGPRPG